MSPTKAKVQAPGLAQVFTDEDIEKCRQEKGLLAIDIQLTQLCNLRCRYCYAASGRSYDNELTVDEMKRIIDEAIELGARVANLTGGEALASKAFFPIAEYAVLRGMQVMCFTNGTLIDEEAAARMLELGVCPCVKLDSLDPEIQDFLCDSPKSLERTLKGIDNLLKAGYGTDDNPGISLNCVVCKTNLDSIPGMWRWARERGIVPNVARAAPVGRGKDNLDILVGTSDLKGLYSQLAEIDEEFSFHWRPDIPWAGGRACRRYYIGIYVDARGFVQSCSELEVQLGNVRDMSLREIMALPQIDQCRNMRSQIKGACGTCTFADNCYGCRGLAYAVTGDLFAADPLCWNNPECLQSTN